MASKFAHHVVTAPLTSAANARRVVCRSHSRHNDSKRYSTAHAGEDVGQSHSSDDGSTIEPQIAVVQVTEKCVHQSRVT